MSETTRASVLVRFERRPLAKVLEHSQFLNSCLDALSGSLTDITRVLITRETVIGATPARLLHQVLWASELAH